MDAEALSPSPPSARLACYAAAKNKALICDVLKDLAPPRKRIVEVASGTGEHAECFLSALGDQIELYQPTEFDFEAMQASISDWTKDFSRSGVCRAPIRLDVSIPETYSALERATFDCLININMVHISPAQTTGDLFTVADSLLQPSGLILLYGPFRVGGEMVESNVKFDESLKSRNEAWGIRDLEFVEAEANGRGFQLVKTISMPSNNLSLVFGRK